MGCIGDPVLQYMKADLYKCNWWVFGRCLRESHNQFLEEDSDWGAIEWTMGPYFSGVIGIDGWYRVTTTHRVTWVGGSATSISRSQWIRMD